MDESVKDGVLLKELKLLTGLAGGPRLTHVELAKLAGMSPAMVNNYMSRLSPFSAVEKAESSDHSQNLLRRYWQHSCRT